MNDIKLKMRSQNGIETSAKEMFSLHTKPCLVMFG